ncbi:endothelin-3 [Amia ocellicauda]|uniref:endothelin-3 n=1 Tax=Amia ocellicauda TaxID=2972642 RepID=UPI003464E56F
MASASLMDLGLWLLIGLTAAFAKGPVPVRSEGGAVGLARMPGLEAPRMDRLAASPAGGPSGGLEWARPAGAPACPGCQLSKPRRRSRRCTCYTYTDKECVYYCHLDIIWINTPERTVPYGLSSYRGSGRVRRSAERVRDSGRTRLGSQRCVCSDQRDPWCASFCRAWQRSP